MDATDLAFAGLTRQAQLIRDGEISPRELVEVYLERIERLDPQLNAFRVTFAERALSEADQAAARRAGRDRRPLLGLPIAIKDDVDVAGEVTAYGTAMDGRPAVADAEVVRRLRASGALIIGKTNVPELMQWPFTETPTWGATRNPWDPSYTPGGSSGGSATAVAAGLVGAALGSDGAGSIRIPSAWCGVFGLKPQRGRVPLAPRPEGWNGMSVNGPITRSVADAGLFLDAVCGPSAVDRDSAPPPARPFVVSAKGTPDPLRIAYSLKVPPGAVARLAGELREALLATVELLRSLGHDVRERDPDYGPGAMPTVVARYLRGIHDDAETVPYPDRLESRTRGMARLGGLIPAPVLEKIRKREAALRTRVGSVLEDHDVLLTPVTAGLPFKVGGLGGRGALWTLNAVATKCPFTGLWNATGQPAAAVPAGFERHGLPLAVQLIGRTNDEATLLSLAAQIEAARPWADRRPALAA
jgi:amidase